MKIILLSGGSGTRLWPLSNEVRSKQFLKVFKTEDGSESMVQRVYRMIKAVDEDAQIYVATSQNQVPQIKAQLGDNVGISVEPCRRDTFPAIALACAMLEKNGVSKDESIVVCPVDPYVNEDYYKCLKEISDNAGNENLTLMGIKPSYPSTKYGYILPNGKFTEKPDENRAQELIDEGAMWNGGVFGFKLGYMLSKIKELLGSSDYDELLNKYNKLEKISIDYALAEKEPSIKVIPFSGSWKDIGTWNTLTEAMSDPIRGNVIADECKNTHIINELSIPLVASGIEDAVIVATPDGILASKKENSERLKDFVTPHRPMCETRIWGEYTVLDYHIQSDGYNSLTKHLIISKGQHISYQKHQLRTEIWMFIEGAGKLIINGEVKAVSRGDTIVIPANTKHAIKADTELHIIEVQIGTELTESDIERLDWDWNKELYT